MRRSSRRMRRPPASASIRSPEPDMADAAAPALTIDPSQIQGLLAAFAPDKKLALNQALFAAGMGLLGMRKGAEGQDAGRAGLLGLGTYNQSLQQQLAQRAAEMQGAAQGIGTLNAAQQFEDMQRWRQVLQGQQGAPMAMPP